MMNFQCADSPFHEEPRSYPAGTAIWKMVFTQQFEPTVESKIEPGLGGGLCISRIT